MVIKKKNVLLHHQDKTSLLHNMSIVTILKNKTFIDFPYILNMLIFDLSD